MYINWQKSWALTMCLASRFTAINALLLITAALGTPLFGDGISDTVLCRSDLSVALGGGGAVASNCRFIYYRGDHHAFLRH
ncbi:hypothetical protein P4S55_25120 [Shewanella sp. PP-Sp27a-2]